MTSLNSKFEKLESLINFHLIKDIFDVKDLIKDINEHIPGLPTNIKKWNKRVGIKKT